MTETENVVGYLVSTADSDKICDQIADLIRVDKKPLWVACLNPHSYHVARNDRAFFDALRAADILLADGIGIVLASRWGRGRIKARVTGSDIFQGVNIRLNQNGPSKTFLLGGSSDTLIDMRRRMAQDFPNIELVGAYSPPFMPSYGVVELDKIVNMVNCSGTDLLWVGLGAPKQEKLIHELLPRLNIRAAFAVGAVFDFYTGRVKRSHPIFQAVGLEWLPRLLQQPGTLWRRTFISAPVFFFHVLMKRF